MSKRLLTVALAITLFSAVEALAQTTVRCESNDGRYHECTYNGWGSIMLTRQISNNTCIEGQTWGVRNNVVWVDNGCRADFVVTQGNNRRMARSSTVVCESQNRKRTECAADTSFGVAFGRQLSRDNCIENRSYGYTGSGIWVSNGCRAEFILGGNYNGNAVRINPSAAISSYSTTIDCESVNNRRNYCAADTIGGVQLSRQLSNKNCVEGRDWGWDSSGVWVSNGCRAQFVVGGGYANMPQYSSYTSAVRCESINGRRNYCKADTRFGVQLGQQISNDSCIFNRDWGYDSGGIWVRNGCRADFYVNH